MNTTTDLPRIPLSALHLSSLNARKTRTGWLPKPLRGTGYALKTAAPAKPAAAKKAAKKAAKAKAKPAKKPAAKKAARKIK